MAKDDMLSLDAPSSPEQLDRCIRITSPMNWLAIGVLGLMALAVAAWSVLGELPSRVQGLGFVVLSEYQNFRLTAGAAGTIEKVYASTGDPVKKGAVLFTIVRPDIELELDQAIEKAEAQERSLAQEVKTGEADVGRRRVVSNAKIATLANQVAAQKRHLVFLKQQLADQKEDLKLGYLKRSDVEETQTALTAAEIDIGNFRNQILTEQSSLREFEHEKKSKIGDLQRVLREAAGEVEKLRLQLASSEQIKSPADGHILQLSAKSGDRVALGDELALIGLPRGDRMVRGYLSLGDAQQVRVGLPVRVSLASISPEIYGTMKGEISKISEAPITRAALLDQYENADIVDLIMGEGPPYMIEVELLKDASTPSGFAWSTSRGPARPIASGSLANIAVTYESRRPIEFVLPIFGQLIGRDSGDG